MNIESLQPATFIRRYKRFLADIRLPSGDVVTVHCPNTGAMTGCCVPNSRCWYSTSTNDKRKYPYTLEWVTTDSGHRASINTHRANGLIKEALNSSFIDDLRYAESIKSEVRYEQASSTQTSRLDFLLTFKKQQPSYIEVKSVTLARGDGLGVFPDAVSLRATKHIHELIDIANHGFGAYLIFCIQHEGINRVEPANDIDPIYAQSLQAAVKSGVKVLAYSADFNLGDTQKGLPPSIVLANKCPVLL